ncbi:MAG: cell division protein FtsW [Fibrobacter sp.]|jgi:cell division protein FtsW|nr:cell division protein FtsW [Fibrobacter sp.]
MGSNQNKGVNKLLLLSTILLILFGIVVVYTASSPTALRKYGDSEFYLKSHCIKVVIAFIVMFIASRVDYSIWKKFARPIFVVASLLTFYTIVAGAAEKGASRWAFGIQPSEILKFGLILMIATKLSDAGTEIKTFKCSIVQPGVFLLISGVLLALQPNFSMLAMFVGIFTVMLIVADANTKYMLQTYGGVAGAGALVVGLHELWKKLTDDTSRSIYEHVKDRIDAFMNPEQSAKAMEKAFQSKQSLEALGNGGFLGTGVGNSAHKLGFLPEAHKDVVYSVVGEEFGFVGTCAVLVAFGIIFYQGFEIARNSSTRFGKYLAVALTISLFFNFAVHVCVSTGLIPTTGQPLPFLSYGGSNLIMSGLFIGVLLNISKAGTGKQIVEPFMGGTKANTFTFSGFDITRAET